MLTVSQIEQSVLAISAKNPKIDKWRGYYFELESKTIFLCKLHKSKKNSTNSANFHLKMKIEKKNPDPEKSQFFSYTVLKLTR